MFFRSRKKGLLWIAVSALLTMLLAMPQFGCRGKAPTANRDGAETEGGTETDDGTNSDGTNSDGASEAEHTGANDRNSADGKSAAAGEAGKVLYARHCAACHGEIGDGQGIAAVYLYPKPRNFRMGRFRLVSTVNRTPSRDDLLSVLRRGMPGSSMPPWNHLPDKELNLLVDEVQRMHQQGVRDEFVRVLVEEEELTEEEIQDADIQEEIRDYVKQRIAPGETTQVPPIAEAEEESIARGKELYMRQACNKCHGDTGHGDGQQQMVDDEGYPMTPRDFTAGIFKGGDDPASIYRRIAYGMPGTPMPSSQLKPSEIIDLSQFVLSLSDEQTRQNARLKRRQIVAKRVANLPAHAEDSAWSKADVTTMRMMPLWWRNEPHPFIEVQAVHDGTNVAVRLVWQDDSHDMHAVTSGHFEDAVAVELYQGEEEPFLGMGGPGAPIDAWLWDADRQTAAGVEDQYPNTVVDIYPFHEKQVDTAEGNRPGAQTSAQPDISLPAVASGNPIVPHGDGAASGGSDLTAGGPETVTFRMPKNQSVDAYGEWKDGKWTVVMKRSLETLGETGGVSLKPGERVSIAFAVFNGAKNDRDGQKLITVWNDLTLED